MRMDTAVFASGSRFRLNVGRARKCADGFSGVRLTVTPKGERFGAIVELSTDGARQLALALLKKAEVVRLRQKLIARGGRAT